MPVTALAGCGSILADSILAGSRQCVDSKIEPVSFKDSRVFCDPESPDIRESIAQTEFWRMRLPKIEILAQHPVEFLLKRRSAYRLRRLGILPFMWVLSTARTKCPGRFAPMSRARFFLCPFLGLTSPVVARRDDWMR